MSDSIQFEELLLLLLLLRFLAFLGAEPLGESRAFGVSASSSSVLAMFVALVRSRK